MNATYYQRTQFCVIEIDLIMFMYSFSIFFLFSTLLNDYKDYTSSLLLILMPVGSYIAVHWALFSLVATDILWICFTSFNRLRGLQLTNLATQNHWKYEPRQHSPWPWRAFLTHPATLGKHAMYSLAAYCCFVMNWPRYVAVSALSSSFRFCIIPISHSTEPTNTH